MDMDPESDAYPDPENDVDPDPVTNSSSLISAIFRTCRDTKKDKNLVFCANSCPVSVLYYCLKDEAPIYSTPSIGSSSRDSHFSRRHREVEAVSMESFQMGRTCAFLADFSLEKNDQ